MGFCCVQVEINGLDACTTVEWCNAAQANCEGSCDGLWSDLSAPVPTPAPTPSQSFCCVQMEINGPDACTTVEWRNAAQANCEGPCDGLWSDLSPAPPVQPPVSPPTPAPVPAPTPPSIPTPAPVPTQSFCCVQVEINGADACTTVEWCNAAQANCEGPCEGLWSDSSLFI